MHSTDTSIADAKTGEKMYLTIEIDDTQFDQLARSGQSYLAYGKSQKRAAEIQAEAVIRNTLTGHSTPVCEPRVPERFAG